MADVTLLVAILTLLFGIAVIVSKRFLRVLVGGYFVLIGLIRLLAYLL